MPCSKCHNEGHNCKSIDCPLNNEIYIEKFNNFKHLVLNEYKEDHEEIATLLNISITQVKNFMSAITDKEKIDSTINNIPFFNKKYNELLIKCFDCNIKLFSNKSFRIWKTEKICNDCYYKQEYKEERNNISNYIQEKSRLIGGCYFCDKKFINYRSFNYDHKNIFDKETDICSLIREGVDDYKIIDDELEKCNLLCVSCHNFITFLENNLPFIKMKKALNRYYINKDNINIDEVEYNKKIQEYYCLYNEVLVSIYPLIKKIIIDKKNEEKQLKLLYESIKDKANILYKSFLLDLESSIDNIDINVINNKFNILENNLQEINNEENIIQEINEENNLQEINNEENIIQEINEENNLQEINKDIINNEENIIQDNIAQEINNDIIDKDIINNEEINNKEIILNEIVNPNKLKNEIKNRINYFCTNNINKKEIKEFVKYINENKYLIIDDDMFKLIQFILIKKMNNIVITYKQLDHNKRSNNRDKELYTLVLDNLTVEILDSNELIINREKTKMLNLTFRKNDKDILTSDYINYSVNVIANNQKTLYKRIPKYFTFIFDE